MVIWSFKNILLSHLATMYMTVSPMIIDTQETFAVRIRAFPAFRRSLYLFCHRYSFLARSPNRTVVKISCHCLGHKDLRNSHEVHQLYHFFPILQAISSLVWIIALPNGSARDLRRWRFYFLFLLCLSIFDDIIDVSGVCPSISQECIPFMPVCR